MTIELNVITTPQLSTDKKGKSKEDLTHKRSKQSIQHSSLGNGCSFQFKAKGTGKVKAIVAKRRVQSKANKDIKSSSEKYCKNFTFLKKDEDKRQSKQILKESTRSDDLMLNIVSGQQSVITNETQNTKELKSQLDKECQTNKIQGTNEKLKEVQQSHHITETVNVETAINDKKSVVETSPQSRPKKKLFPKKTIPGVSSVGLFKDQPVNIEIGPSLVRPVKERIFSDYKVSQLGLHPHAVKNLADLLSITRLTTVQHKTIPKILEGKDVLVRSQTGSGKTLAYALPIVEKLQAIRPKLMRTNGIQAVIIVPSRELAVQTYELFLKLVKPFTWLVPGVLMGGEKRKAEKARLRKGISILIGTPGRLVDHLLHTGTFRLEKAQFLVLDEADRLLEMGYERDVQQIVAAINNHREEKSQLDSLPSLQKLLLSATLTSAVRKLAGLTLQEPIFIDNSDEDSCKSLNTGDGYNKESIEASVQLAGINDDDNNSIGILTIPENLKLFYIIVPPKLRLVILAGLLLHEYSKKSKLKALVFMSTTEMVNYHHDLFMEQLTKKVLDVDDDDNNNNGVNDIDDLYADHDVDDDVIDIGQKIAKGQGRNVSEEEPLLKNLRFFKLHGSMSQTERQGVFKGFRECENGVLFATDVVGRGIDVPEIDVVIQYSPPQKIADFVHRVGRTARAGRKGLAILFLTPSEVQFIRYLEDKRIRITRYDMNACLKALKSADSKAHTEQEAASNLQYRFEQLLEEDKEIHDKACKAFVSWVKFYTTFPRELKPMFNTKTAHMGHFAKSFCLKDAPTNFVRNHTAPKPLPPTNRLTYTERDPEKVKQEKKNKRKHGYATTVTGEKRNMLTGSNENKLVKLLPSTRAMTISEYDSGMPAAKKKKN